MIDANDETGRVTLIARDPAKPYLDWGDVLFIRDDGTGVMSATGRGGDRILYALTSHDVRFYLEAHDLVTGRVMMMRRTA